MYDFFKAGEATEADIDAQYAETTKQAEDL
jgi:hypothetical protein